MSTIDLDRQFVEWTEGRELSNSDLLAQLELSEGGLDWPDLLKRRRVVILAEAGSGKSEEMRAQALRVTAAGKFAFFATVEDVGREGLSGALNADGAAHLVQWQESDQHAWFFIDSVDEAKLRGVGLEKALRKLGDGIRSAEGRAHVILSGRYTDWEFRRDRERLNQALALPPDRDPLPPPDPDQALVSALRHEKPKAAPESESALVVVMQPLDEGRVIQFAAGKHLNDRDAFLGQIAAAQLWRFARRPLDLDWLVEFWRKHGRLGLLSEMLETSLSERLRERDLDRSRRDQLDAARAEQAIERVGAALVFGRETTIRVPDTEITLSSEGPGLALEQVLPDWEPAKRLGLLGRPVFDPATFGRARLHNDNEGVVRAYLAARWLRRLRSAGLPTQTLLDLLFATVYGIDLVKPSMAETAAWLALWDADVARELARRDRALLVTAGDPASLPSSLRCAILERIVADIVAGDREAPLLDADSVQRFSRPDLAETVRTLWSTHKDNKIVRDLLLRMIWLGRITACRDIAEEAAFGALEDPDTRFSAGRALAETADDATKRRYAEAVKAGCRTLPKALVMDTVDGLFPGILGVSDLLELLASTDVEAWGGEAGFDWRARRWPDRLMRPDLEQLVNGLLQQLGDLNKDAAGYPPDERERVFFPTIRVAATCLLALSPDNDAPAAAVDAFLRLAVCRDEIGRRRSRSGDWLEQLNRTAPRRRVVFWRAAERWNGHRVLGQRLVDDPFQLHILGCLPALRLEDVSWLLTDGSSHTHDHGRRLAINAAMMLWRDAGKPDEILARISATAAHDRVMRETLEVWLNPPPESAELQAMQQEAKVASQRAKDERAKLERSWIDFAARLRADPEQLSKIPPPTDKGTDGRLLYLWELLSSTSGSSHYAISTVGPLEAMFGPAVAAAFCERLIAHWRGWPPQLKSTREPDKLNQVRKLDCLGIVGITLEAAADRKWAHQITGQEARAAAAYATIEMNGFPTWLSDLVTAKPEETAGVLVGEIVAELERVNTLPRLEVLNDVAHADAVIKCAVAPALLKELERRPELPAAVLDSVLSIVGHVSDADRPRLARLTVDRCNQTVDPEFGAIYLSAAFAVDPQAAVVALSAKLDQLDAASQTAWAARLLPSLFGDRFGFAHSHLTGVDLPFDCLERLVTIAWATVRVEDDRQRPALEVYSPDIRDAAESARNAAFKRLIDTPGRATFDALQRFAAVPGFPVSPSRLRRIAEERAAADSEAAPWPPGEPKAFEADFDTAPRTTRDLQLVALHRFADMQHELLHGEFNQGGTLAAQPDETAVQNWVADRLRQESGRAYSVERESHVADEKEPDIRVRAKASDASAPIEVKVAERWTLEQLEEAVEVQLCGRYLRTVEARHGIMLLVHQRRRPRGWKDPATQRMLDFAEVMANLREVAIRICGSAPNSPQPEITVLDVSSCRKADRAQGAKRARRRAAKAGAVKAVPEIAGLSRPSGDLSAGAQRTRRSRAGSRRPRPQA